MNGFCYFFANSKLLFDGAWKLGIGILASMQIMFYLKYLSAKVRNIGQFGAGV